jgi:nucleotide-binding universal stress UspA family protein
MKTILVPLDGSELAEQSLPYAQLLAKALGARVRLLRVINDIEHSDVLRNTVPIIYGMGSAVHSVRERERVEWERAISGAENYLDIKAIELRGAHVEVSIEVRIGAPAEIIIETAGQDDMALIVMATHGYSGLKRWTLGSVTDKVVHAAKVPVFAVRAVTATQRGVPELQRILVPLDDTEMARQALPFARQLAAQTHAEVLLLEAVPSIDTPDGMFDADVALPESPELIRREHGRAHRQLDGLAQELRESDVQARSLVLGGNPVEIISEEAIRHHSDVIVMATHGHIGLRRLAFGSVADRVLHATTIPLLLVRAHDDRTE